MKGNVGLTEEFPSIFLDESLSPESLHSTFNLMTISPTSPPPIIPISNQQIFPNTNPTSGKQPQKSSSTGNRRSRSCSFSRRRSAERYSPYYKPQPRSMEQEERSPSNLSRRIRLSHKPSDPSSQSAFDCSNLSSHLVRSAAFNSDFPPLPSCPTPFLSAAPTPKDSVLPPFTLPTLSWSAQTLDLDGSPFR